RCVTTVSGRVRNDRPAGGPTKLRASKSTTCARRLRWKLAAMPFGKMLDNVSPAEIVEAAAGHELRAFLTLYGDTLLLIVRLRSGDTELASGLGSAVIHGGTSM